MFELLYYYLRFQGTGLGGLVSLFNTVVVSMNDSSNKPHRTYKQMRFAHQEPKCISSYDNTCYFSTVNSMKRNTFYDL